MSDYRVIGAVGETLKSLLKQDGMFTDADGNVKIDVVLKSPKEVISEGDVTPKVSIFLYQALENPYLKNVDPTDVNPDPSSSVAILESPPMALDLYYLITPFHNTDPTEEKYILGRVLQIFFDNPILRGKLLKTPLNPAEDEIRLVFHPIPLDDLTKLWSMFPDTPYRHSVCYLATPVLLSSSQKTKDMRVMVKEMVYLQAEEVRNVRGVE